MIKIFSALIFAAAAFSSTNAMAWSFFEISGEKLEIDGKVVKVYSKDFKGDYIYHSKSKEMEGGIYVIAAAAPFALNPLPKTTEAIRAYLLSKGFKVVDKAEGAALGIKFVVSGMKLDWPDGATPTGGSGNAAGNIATSAAVNAVAGSALGLMSYGIGGSGHYSGTPLKLAASSIPNPTDEGMGVEFSEHAEHLDFVTAYSGIRKDELDVTPEELLKVMTNYWLKNFFVQD